MILWVDIIGLLGFSSVAVALLLLARLSRRLGTVTHAQPHYRGLYLAALLVFAGVAARLGYLTNFIGSGGDLTHNLVYIVLCDGLPALGVTLGVMVTWYYWSWLLAERD
jgi:hypothetical protein